MEFTELIAMIVFFGCVSGVFHKALDVFGRRKSVADRQALEAELRAVRQENAELKKWASDLILSFDSTIHQHDLRLQSLERHALTDGRAASHSEPERLHARTRV